MIRISEQGNSVKEILLVIILITPSFDNLFF